MKDSDLESCEAPLEAAVELYCFVFDKADFVGEVVVDDVTADDNVGPKIVVNPTYGSTFPILFCAASVNHMGG